MIVIDHVFFLNDTATPEIYTLSLHDALPICLPRGLFVFRRRGGRAGDWPPRGPQARGRERERGRPRLRRRGGGGVARRPPPRDRKSTRLNSSHANISYVVFCLKKNKFKHIYQ